MLRKNFAGHKQARIDRAKQRQTEEDTTLAKRWGDNQVFIQVHRMNLYTPPATERIK